MSTLTMTLDQPLVIPDDFLRALHLTRHDKMRIQIEGQRIVLEREASQSAPRASLVRDEDTGRLVLSHPPGSPPITDEMVSDILNELP